MPGLTVTEKSHGATGSPPGSSRPSSCSATSRRPWNATRWRSSRRRRTDVEETTPPATPAGPASASEGPGPSAVAAGTAGLDKPPGWGQVHDVILPHRGRDERPFFCEVDEGIIAGAGLVGVVLGWIDLGLLGAALGLWAGVKLCRMALEDDRPSRR